MLTYKIHLIRHGMTAANIEGKYIGQTDVPLCPEGIVQLEDCIAQSEYPAVGRVYTSPLQRAVQTARMLYPEHELYEIASLREFDFGQFENKSMHELENDPQFIKWIGSGPQAHVPGGESGEEMLARAIGALEEIYAQMMQHRIHSAAVITHGGLIMSLLAAKGLPQREAVRWNMDFGKGYTILMSAQMWMRDNKFEVYEQLPYPLSMDEER